MSDVIKKLITVDAIEKKVIKLRDGSGEFTKYTVKDSDGKKYNFGMTKKNGEPSAPYQAIKESRVKIDDRVGIAFWSEGKTFEGRDGNKIPYTDRKVAFFFDKDELPDEEEEAAEKTEKVSDIPF